MGANATARIVDLDAASILNNGIATIPEPVFEAQAIVRLNLILQTSIELPEILRLFYQEARRAVQMDGISYQHSNPQFSFETGIASGHTSHYRLQTRCDFLGELSLHRTQQAFCDEELRRLDRLVETLIYPVRNGLRYLEAVRASLTDGLTGAGNRIHLESVMNREVEQAHRYQDALSVLVLDLDHFKRINDEFGHATGDYVLKMVAKTLAANSRCADMTFRFGGEEFVILLNKTASAGAKITAERIRRNIERLTLHYASKLIPVSVSIGVATLSRGESKEDLLVRADRALYQAKQNGRNQVVVAEPALATATNDVVIQ